ncbi:MAG: methyltransferase domain-containing protein [Spartobacteria bacterium]|nr:methyltransferase domain-containing protein [Spartobacteria bacterium]
MNKVSTIFKALSDEGRLRILRALSMAELSVAELVSILGAPQSTVSRHLKPLRDNRLVGTRRDGTTIYYRLGTCFNETAFSDFITGQFSHLPMNAQDRASIRRVLDLRKQKSKSFFDGIAGSYGTLTEPGGGWQALAAGLAVGFTAQIVADLGAGEGDLTLLLGRYARRVTAVDQSNRMLHVIEDRADELGIRDRIQTIEGDIEKLPLPDAGFDTVFLSQSLHHAAHPPTAIAEAARILNKPGLMIILDLARHTQEWLRDEWADHWMGFQEEEVKNWIEATGLTVMTSERLKGSTPELAVLLTVAVKS